MKEFERNIEDISADLTRIKDLIIILNCFLEKANRGKADNEHHTDNISNRDLLTQLGLYVSLGESIEEELNISIARLEDIISTSIKNNIKLENTSI